MDGLKEIINRCVRLTKKEEDIIPKACQEIKEEKNLMQGLLEIFLNQITTVPNIMLKPSDHKLQTGLFNTNLSLIKMLLWLSLCLCILKQAQASWRLLL